MCLLGVEEEAKVKPVCQFRQVLMEFSSIDVLYMYEWMRGRERETVVKQTNNNCHIVVESYESSLIHKSNVALLVNQQLNMFAVRVIWS